MDEILFERSEKNKAERENDILKGEIEMLRVKLQLEIQKVMKKDEIQEKDEVQKDEKEEKDEKCECSCDDESLTRTRTCLQCKVEEKIPMSYNERVSNCKQHYMIISNCPDSGWLCQSCREQGYCLGHWPGIPTVLKKLKKDYQVEEEKIEEEKEIDQVEEKEKESEEKSDDHLSNSEEEKKEKVVNWGERLRNIRVESEKECLEISMKFVDDLLKDKLGIFLEQCARSCNGSEEKLLYKENHIFEIIRDFLESTDCTTEHLEVSFAKRGLSYKHTKMYVEFYWGK